jgi:hypothetical protein
MSNTSDPTKASLGNDLKMPQSMAERINERLGHY